MNKQIKHQLFGEYLFVKAILIGILSIFFYSLYKEPPFYNYKLYFLVPSFYFGILSIILFIYKLIIIPLKNNKIK